MNKKLWQIVSIIILATSIPAIAYRFIEAESLLSKFNLLGYFTIQSNLIVIFLVSFSLFNIRVPRKWELAAVTSMGITALIFQLFLRSDTNPGLFLNIISNINHGSTTVLFVLWYWFFPGKETLGIKQIWAVIPYPALYCIYGVSEGFIKDTSRYFFLDIQTIGWSGFGIWFVILTLMFLGIGLLTLKIDKLIKIN